MAPVLLARTTASTVPGAPPFLRKIWTRLYPSAPPPEYRVFQDRPLGSVTSEFTATVTLVSGPDPNGPVYTFRSRIMDRMTRAVNEAAFDAILILRTFDPEMDSDPRYSLFPRLDIEDGSIHYAPPALGPDSPISNFMRYASLLEYYLRESILAYAILRNDTATANLACASGVDISFLDSPVTTPPPSGPSQFWGTSRRSTLESFQEMLHRDPSPPPSPPPPSPRIREPLIRVTTHSSWYLARFTPRVRSPTQVPRHKNSDNSVCPSKAVLRSPSPSPGIAEYEAQLAAPAAYPLPLPEF